jgi:hypothetical protein
MPSGSTESGGNQPVHTIRKHSLKVSIWKNETRGGPMYNAVLLRTYKDEEEFKDTSSLGFSDLANAAKILLDAESWIGEQVAREKAEANSPPPKTSARR